MIKDSLSKYVDAYAGGTPNRSNSEFYGGTIPWISSGEVNQPYITDTIEKITEEGLNNSSAKWIPKGAVLVAMYGATAGQISKTKIDATSNQAVLALIPNKDLIDADYLYYLLKYNKENLLLLTRGSAQPNLNKEVIINYPLSIINSIPVQQHVARILSTADAVIEKTQAAIAKYKAIKQGMLQDLFTRGVKSEKLKVKNEKGEWIEKEIWKLRPRYEDAPELYKESKLGMIPREWEVLPVSLVSENLDGARIPVKQEDRDRQQEVYPYYGASGIIDYVEDYIFDEPLILLGEDGENVISRNLPLAFKVTGKIWVNNHAHVLRPIPTVVTIDFLSEMLESINYSSIVSGTAQPKITQGALSEVLLPIPNMDEQLIMSERIISITNKLQTEQAYLQKMQSIKRGLMEDLLSGK